MNKWLLLSILAGAAIMLHKKAWAIPPDGRKYQGAFTSAELSYGIPHNLLARVAYQESRFRDDIIHGDITSAANAVGLMQIVPKWHPDVNPLDPFDSINYAGYYLRQNYDRFGSWDKALAAYNWGPTALNRSIKEHGDNWINHAPTETRNYVSEILKDVPV